MTPIKIIQEIPAGFFLEKMKKIWKDNWNKLENNSAGIFLRIEEFSQKILEKKPTKKRYEKTLENNLKEEFSPQRIYGWTSEQYLENKNCRYPCTNS